MNYIKNLQEKHIFQHFQLDFELLKRNQQGKSYSKWYLGHFETGKKSGQTQVFAYDAKMTSK